MNIVLKNITLDDVNKMTHIMNNKLDDDNDHYVKVNKENQIDAINYNICVQEILKSICKKIKNETNVNKKILLFTFNIDDECPHTNYSYITIFFGPLDNDKFYELNHSYKYIGEEISILLKNLILEDNFYLEINENFKFDLFYLPRALV